MSSIRKQLAAELKAARTLAGLSQRALRDRLGGEPSQVSLSRIEQGLSLPDRALCTRWLTACAATAESVARTEALAEAAHNETRAWADMLGDELHLQGVARIRDEDAALIRNCQVAWIPGLLQTAEYARHIAPLIDPQSKFDHAVMVADRMKRQEILYGTGRRFQFLISEAALLWEPGPDVMAAQLARLESVATLAAVDIAVLPLRRVGAPSWHSFVYREAAEDRSPSITTELVHGGGSITDPARVEPYRAVWEGMWSASVAGDAMRLILQRAANQIHESGAS